MWQEGKTLHTAKDTMRCFGAHTHACVKRSTACVWTHTLCFQLVLMSLRMCGGRSFLPPLLQPTGAMETSSSGLYRVSKLLSRRFACGVLLSHLLEQVQHTHTKKLHFMCLHLSKPVYNQIDEKLSLRIILVIFPNFFFSCDHFFSQLHSVVYKLRVYSHTALQNITKIYRILENLFTL